MSGSSSASGSRLVLASGSPRRLELLRLAGFDPQIRPADVDESVRDGEAPEDYVARLARAKALAVARAEDEVVLGADTTVVLDGRLLGKPADASEAAATLRRLSGRTHRVLSGVAVVDRGGAVHELVVGTAVVLARLDEATIAGYVASGEPLDKAGAYGIQGRAQVFVAEVRGSWTNAVGLPAVEAARLLRNAGVGPNA